MNETRGRELGDRVQMADRWWPRLRGLLGSRSLSRGEGLILDPCRAVHMFGMRYPLDVAFVGGGGRVVALYRDLAPGSRTRWHGEARQAVELPIGTLAETGTVVGDVLRWEPSLVGASTKGAEA